MKKTNSKTCSKCNETKPIDHFHKETRKPDGHSPWCKPCKNTHAIANMKTRLQDPSSPASKRKRLYKIVWLAVARGDLIRPDRCPKCKQETDSKEMHAHHHDYEKPLEVEWMCRTCHTEDHTKERAAALPDCPYCGDRIKRTGRKTCESKECTKMAQVMGGTLSARRPDNSPTIAEEMRREMEQLGLSRAELSRRMGVSSAYVSLVLNKVFPELRRRHVETTKQ